MRVVARERLEAGAGRHFEIDPVDRENPDNTWARLVWQMPEGSPEVTYEWAQTAKNEVVGRLSHSQPADLVLEGYVPWDNAPPKFSVLYSEGPERRFLRGRSWVPGTRDGMRWVLALSLAPEEVSGTGTVRWHGYLRDIPKLYFCGRQGLTYEALEEKTRTRVSGRGEQGLRSGVAPRLREVLMTGLHVLWLPILLSSVIVFVVSSLIHMVLPWHKSDYPKMPNEDKAMEALRPLAIPPGDYMVPRPSSREEMRSPDFLEKLNKGPVMVLTVMPNGPWSMGRNLILWFFYLVVVSLFSAYVAGRALPAGATFLHVFRFAGTAAFLGYSLALWQMWIWYRRSWSITLKATVDGLMYALLTAATFGWLWPR
jgi:hypothetical protein